MHVWKRLLAAGVTAVSMGMASSASAVLITEWRADFDNGFDNFTGGPSVQGVPGTENNIANYGDTFTSLRWGVDQGNGQSSLSVEEGPTGVQVFTNGGPEPTVDITHNNVQVGLGQGTLDRTDLVSQLTLTPVAPPGGNPVIDQDVRIFEIDFTETNNFPPGGNCGFPVETQCDDIFILLDPVDLVQQFVADEFLYTIRIGTEGDVLQVQDDATCARAGLDPGCVGFTTPEFQSTTLVTNIEITAQRLVPEPGVLALSGLALLGLAVMRRRVSK
jgi:hypothetical protein